MELPEDVLSLSRAYAKPYRTRRDWRTCKLEESECIHTYRFFFRHISTAIFYRNAFLKEIRLWSLYGLMRIFHRVKHLLWPLNFPPIEHGWYERRFLEFRFVPDEISAQLIYECIP